MKSPQHMDARWTYEVHPPKLNHHTEESGPSSGLAPQRHHSDEGENEDFLNRSITPFE